MVNKNGRMDRADRAKQFMPFDALKGLREELAKREITVVQRKLLPEEQVEEIRYNLAAAEAGECITVEYYELGQYRQITDTVSQIHKEKRILEIDGKRIPFDAISQCRLLG